MTTRLNRTALENARKLVSSGKATHDERDDWSKHAPSADDENRFIEKTKGRYSFPFGDFSKVHRCAVISLESRAAQNDYDDIAKASKKLLEQIDGTD